MNRIDYSFDFMTAPDPGILLKMVLGNGYSFMSDLDENTLRFMFEPQNLLDYETRLLVDMIICKASVGSKKADMARKLYLAHYGEDSMYLPFRIAIDAFCDLGESSFS